MSGISSLSKEVNNTIEHYSYVHAKIKMQKLKIKKPKQTPPPKKQQKNLTESLELHHLTLSRDIEFS